MNSTSTLDFNALDSRPPATALFSDYDDVRDAYEEAVLASSSSASKIVQNDYPRIDGDGEELSDAELRQIYDDEEVDHFLKLFSSHVTEVYLPPPPGSSSRAPKRKVTLVGEDLVDVLSQHDAQLTSTGTIEVSEPESSVPEAEGDWVNVGTAPTRAEAPYVSPLRYVAQALASQLPDPHPHPASPFSLTALRVALQRLYMVGYPTYIPLLISLYRLSTWKDAPRSAGYCLLYFILWHYDLLPAALVVRNLHSLLKRRFLPYPTAEDLRKRRQRAAETELLGNTMDQFSGSWSWLSLTPVLAAAGRDVPLGDALKTIRNISKAKKAKLKSKAAEALSEATKDVPLEEQRKTQQQAKEELRRRKQEEDWKAAIVWFLEGLADVHERVRNVFLWRREDVSMRYAYAIGAILLATLVLPLYWLVKFILFALGVLFWVLIPLVRAMTPEERARLPPLFGDAPTDVDYAIEVIGKRTAKGEALFSTKSPKGKKDATKPSSPSPGPPATNGTSPFSLGAALSSTVDLATTVSPASLLPTPTVDGEAQAQSGVRERAGSSTSVKARSFVSAIEEKDWDWDGKRQKLEKLLVRGIAKTNKSASASVASLSLEGSVDEPGSSDSSASYLCRYGTSPGLLSLSLSPPELVFIPVGRSDGILKFDLKRIRGVKKAGVGVFNGLSLKYDEGEGGGGGTGVREIKFGWVAKRDELFTKLVGWSAAR